jgi:hypothetical protein
VHLAERIAAPLILIGASSYIVVYVVIACIRLAYPFELEWMEGGAVMHVQRILDGQPLYGAPHLDFVAYIYTPFYFYVASVPAAFIGNGFLPLRLVSFIASLGCFALVFLIVKRRTSSSYAPLAAAGLFAASFRLTGAWFDIARVDSLSLVLLLAGIYLFESPRAAVRSWASALLLFLSFFTKQTTLVVSACLAASACLTRRGLERVLFALVFGLLLGLSSLAMNATTDGWYGYYVFDLPTQHEISTALLLRFWTGDISHLAVALAFSLFAILNRRGRPGIPERVIQDGLLFGGLLLSSYLSRIHAGGYDNVLMPAAAGIAIYFGLGLAEAVHRLRDLPTARLAVTVCAAIQFLSLVYSPARQIPSVADQRAGEQLLERISEFPGEVYWSEHPWYLKVMGKPAQAQDMAVFDIVRGTRSAQLTQFLAADLAGAVDSGRYEAFVLDTPAFTLRPPGFETHYVLVDAGLTGRRFAPVTGARRKPTFLFVRASR